MAPTRMLLLLPRGHNCSTNINNRHFHHDHCWPQACATTSLIMMIMACAGRCPVPPAEATMVQTTMVMMLQLSFLLLHSLPLLPLLLPLLTPRGCCCHHVAGGTSQQPTLAMMMMVAAVMMILAGGHTRHGRQSLMTPAIAMASTAAQSQTTPAVTDDAGNGPLPLSLLQIYPRSTSTEHRLRAQSTEHRAHTHSTGTKHKAHA